VLSRLDDKEGEAVQTVIAAFLHMLNVKRWTQAHASVPVTKAKAKRKASGR